MGLCGGGKDTSDRAKEIERILRKDFAHFKHELKLLLLGTGESGKSTIIKQMRILYGEGFGEQERKDFNVLVFRNILRAIKAMGDALDQLKIPLDQTDLQDELYRILDTDVDKYVDISSDAELFGKLWADAGIQKAFLRRAEFQLSDSTPYYLTPANLARIATPGYIPDVQDVLRAREPTTGIHEYVFELEKAVFRMLDVGGQRSERRKWIHCFENITSIIFIVACSEYDQKLVEEEDANRMDESLALFEQLIGYEWFQKTSFILFLNKSDLLEIKVKTSPINKHFTKFVGDTTDAIAVRNFIADMYHARKAVGSERPIFHHFTTATDTENIKVVFEFVRKTLIANHLKEYNIS